jgi:hypothetical protein
MGLTARIVRQERKERKIAEAVAKRIEEANRPSLQPVEPITGAFRYNIRTQSVEAYDGQKWYVLADANSHYGVQTK